MNINIVGINKSFGNIRANDDINIEFQTGTIHGILGENGAGKSTLMKIISGFQKADRGQIFVDDNELILNSPTDAIKAGIGMLHQDPLDFPPMKVIENFVTGSPQKSKIQGLVPDYRNITRQFLTLRDRFGFTLDPEVHINLLTVGERQQLEILRLLWLGAKVLILDEPTTGISTPQKVLLFETLKILANEGNIILFVSHKLEDVEELCDIVSVLRHGKVVGSNSKPFETDQLISLMFGKQIERFHHPSHELGNILLELTDIVTDDPRVSLGKVSLQVRAGEIIGLAGLEGSGQTEFLKLCSGLVRPSSGSININYKDMVGKPYHDFIENGVSYIPASRLEEGLISDLNISEHFLLINQETGFFLNSEKGNLFAKAKINEYNIKGSPDTIVQSLSGGNQQRTQLALLDEKSKIILLEHPTRGLDVESSIYIWRKLKDRCVNGAAIIFITSDMDEIIEYSDRILVFFAGQISEPIVSHETNSDGLGLLIGGKGWNS